MSAVLCIDEPYASAIFANLKRWETRGQPPNGPMRPEGVQGFPGVRLSPGDDLLIAATQKRPRHVVHDPNDNLPPWCDLYAFAPFVEWTENVDNPGTGVYRWVGSLGCILGRATVPEAVPIVERPVDAPESAAGCISFLRAAGCVVHDDLYYDSWNEMGVEDAFTRISDQLPWGDWTPGRWAWKLTDPVRTDEQCPNDCARFDGRVPGHTMGSNWAWVPCWACKGEGSCPPIPYRGHQGLRAFDAGMLR